MSPADLVEFIKTYQGDKLRKAKSEESGEIHIRIYRIVSPNPIFIEYTMTYERMTKDRMREKAKNLYVKFNIPHLNWKDKQEWKSYHRNIESSEG